MELLRGNVYPLVLFKLQNCRFCSNEAVNCIRVLCFPSEKHNKIENLLSTDTTGKAAYRIFLWLTQGNKRPIVIWPS